MPVFFVSVRLLPLESVRFAAWLLTRLFYRVRVEGMENIPESGGAVLVANHVSWVDGILLGLACPRHVRMIAYAPYFKGRWSGWFARAAGIIPIQPGAGAVRRAIAAAREALRAGSWCVSFQREDSRAAVKCRSSSPVFCR